MKEVNLTESIRAFETWINTPIANKKRIVVFTGAGVSADSGIATFRDADGLWANYRIEEVCTPEALSINRDKVIEFYNMRRQESLTKKPNDGHIAIAQLEQWADVCVITQNVDNLHEQAGSTRVLHLHGELMKLRSEKNPTLIYKIQEWEQSLDARAKDGALLRPHIVFFGESVPMFDKDCYKKVYSISILLQNKQKTLENDDIQNIMDKIIFVLKKKINLEIREK